LFEFDCRIDSFASISWARRWETGPPQAESFIHMTLTSAVFRLGKRPTSGDALSLFGSRTSIIQILLLFLLLFIIIGRNQFGMYLDLLATKKYLSI
jgi:hypothetical protein